MFGQNPIRKLVKDPINLAVEEMFYTLQGEGPFSGLPAVFIRLAGCNLACHFCDTQFEKMADMPAHVDDIMERFKAAFSMQQRKLVVITGGEPLRQDIVGLVRRLLAVGVERIQIETAGTLWPENLEHWVLNDSVTIVCSPKTVKVHPAVEQFCYHWKYIIRGGEVDPDDGLPNRGTQVANRDKYQRLYRPEPLNKDETIWLSPCDDYDDVLNAVNRELARDLCLKHGYRLSLQLHKLVCVP